MKIVRNLTTLLPAPCALTIGNFDGVHLGHQALLNQLKNKAKQLGLPAKVMIFEPQPNEYFSHQATSRLMRFREKIIALKEAGVDEVICLHFNQQLASQSPHDFVEKLLVAKLNAKYIVVGDDFHFGYRRQGNFSLLQALSKHFGFLADQMPTFQLQGERISSSRIRQRLEQGDLLQAAALLGAPFSMQGKIAHGDKRGRTIGFPTANIQLHRKLSPLQGVYVVDVIGVESNAIPGVANIGIRPTLGGEPKALLEVHLFNFNRDIYGLKVKVRFLQKLRDEIKFDSFEQLKQQIQKDVKQAQECYASNLIKLKTLSIL